MLEVLQKISESRSKKIVMANSMNVLKNYGHGKNVQTAEEKKQGEADNVKKTVLKRKDLVSLKEMKDDKRSKRQKRKKRRLGGQRKRYWQRRKVKQKGQWRWRKS